MLPPSTDTTLDLVRKYYPQLSEPKLQAEIAQHASLHHFPAGEMIQDYGQYIHMVPLILKGSIKVTRMDDDGNELFLYYLNEGETCSMSFICCMTEKRSAIRTVAEDEVEMLGIPIKLVDDWMSRYRSWKNFVMQAYDKRLYELVRTVDSIAFRKMDERGKRPKPPAPWSSKARTSRLPTT